MKRIFTSKIFTKSLAVVVLLVSSFITKGQLACSGGKILYTENFGSGTTSTAWPDVIPGSLHFYETGLLSSEGYYRTIDSTQQKPEWHVSGDHTSNLNGKMLVVNAKGETFFSHEVNSTEFLPGTYQLSAYVMNVDPKGLCGNLALLSIMTFKIEYLSGAGTWVALENAPFKTDPIPQTVAPTWLHLGSGFNLPVTRGFVVQKLRITIGDEVYGTVGCGSDFALDDIELSLCPSGGVTPVTFLDINAYQKGSGVNIDWKTSQEFNSDYFEVEKSANGNTGWFVAATLPAAGNSQVIKQYKAFDASPVSGINYYRIKQFDKDGKFAYSKIVSVRLNYENTSASVLANPFHNRLIVNISSSIQQTVTARLVDIAGKQVAFEKWPISNGNTTKDFSNISALPQGMYIVTVFGSNGEVLLNNKVIKQ